MNPYQVILELKLAKSLHSAGQVPVFIRKL